MRLRPFVVALLASAAIPASAQAAAEIFVFDSSPGTRGLHIVESTVKLHGAIEVDFHGDPAAGCAAAHVCDVKGSVRWAPGGAGSISAVAYRSHKRRFEEAFLAIGDFSDEEQPLRTTARVRRDGVPHSLCADAASGDSGSNGPSTRGASAAIRLIDLPSRAAPSNEILRTHCAGPMAADIAALLPVRRIGEHALVHGQRELDYSADKPFSAHGLAGTVHSNVRIQVLRGHVSPVDTGTARRPRTVRKRAIEVSYRVQRVSGQIGLRLSGLADPDLCGPFDSCGIGGSVTTSLASSSGSASLAAYAPIRRRRIELRRALGLARGRPPRGVDTNGYISWDRDAGTVTSELTRDGAPACTDSIPVAGGGAVYLEFSRGRVRASYISGGGLSGFDALRTRCPGPGAADAPDTLATGTFPLSALRHRRVTLQLKGGSRVTSDGYSSHLSPDVTIVLRRTRIREFTFREELPPDYYPATTRSLR
jgi:hypothetical protein